MDPDYPHLAYGADAKRSLIAKAVLSREGAAARLVSAGADRPAAAARKCCATAMPRFDDAVRFMEWVSEDHPHRFAVDGDEVS